VCLGTACHLRGGPRIAEAFERELKVTAGGTTEDLKYTLETVNCVGACALAPLVVVDKDYFGGLTPDKVKKVLKTVEGRAGAAGRRGGREEGEDVHAAEQRGRDREAARGAEGGQDPKRPMVVVCGGTGCLASGAEKVKAAFVEKLAAAGVDGGVTLKETGCHGFCQRGPVVLVHPQGVFYQKVKPEQVGEIVEKTVQKGETLEALLYDAPDARRWSWRVRSRSTRTSSGSRCGTTDGSTRRISATASRRGLRGAGEGADDEAGRGDRRGREVGLRGRGGGGFATARKWRSCVKAPGRSGTSCATGTRATPGRSWTGRSWRGPAQRDRGMVIGAYAVGRTRGTSTCGWSTRWRSKT